MKCELSVKCERKCEMKCQIPNIARLSMNESHAKSRKRRVGVIVCPLQRLLAKLVTGTAFSISEDWILRYIRTYQ